MPESIPLSVKIEAYYMFLKNYDQGAIAAACGVSTRTIRNWIKDNEWREDQRILEGLVRGIVLSDMAVDFAEFMKGHRAAEIEAGRNVTLDDGKPRSITTAELNKREKS
jgi:uncharacterized protein YjcR